MKQHDPTDENGSSCSLTFLDEGAPVTLVYALVGY